jgi:hypothetical protein
LAGKGDGGLALTILGTKGSRTALASSDPGKPKLPKLGYVEN